MKKPISYTVSFLLSLLMISCVTSCKENNSGMPNVEPPKDIPARTAETDKWLGEWKGPEGTFLKISGGKGKYELIIQDLDGPKSFSGVSVENTIQFQRNGILEKIHKTSGEETGMKWLSDKHNCLTINRGEGFCRD